MRAPITALLCSSVLTAQAAYAEQFFDGNRLKALCSNNREAAEAYVAGWHAKREVDGLFTGMTLEEPDARQMRSAINESSCLPEVPNLKELTDATCDYVERHESELSHKANGLVAASVREKFPCL